MRKLGLALLATASVAHANGRPPLTNGIHFKPGDAHSLYVATTFGLLISHDDGCTMNWICESNLGYGGQWDPKYAVAGDGTIFATTFTGLRVSRDGGCSFSTATSELPVGDPNRIADIWIDALDLGPDGAVWVGTAESGKTNDIFVSTDNGVTFTPKGMQSPSIFWKSVRVAPSNSLRVYIGGYQVAGTLPDGGQMQPTPHFLRTDNGGTSWTESALTGVAFGSTPIVLAQAVDPTNPDIVYMVSLGAAPPTGDRLYRSTNGGTDWTDVLDTTDPIHDVVFRDATTVMVATQTATGPGGTTYISSNNGVAFQPAGSGPQLGCLGKAPDGSLFGCGANWQPDYMAIAHSTDGGANYTKVFRFVELAGPLQCPAGTAERDTCDLAQWDNLKAQFASTGPVCGAGAIDTAGDPPPKKSGCCDTGGSPVGLAWAGAIALWLRRRRS